MPKTLIHKIIAAVALPAMLLLGACREHQGPAHYTAAAYDPEYASLFALSSSDSAPGVLLEVKNPWQSAQGVTKSLLLLEPGQDVPEGYVGEVLRGPARRIVCMSTTHVGMLSALGLADRIVGVSGKRFIYNPDVAENPDVVDVGYDKSVDYEKIIALRPDIVLLYAVDASSDMEKKLRELHIPYAYVAEYLEQTPLGRAEWLVPIGHITGEAERADSIFHTIVPEYEALRELTLEFDSRPRVMLNTPYGGQWMMPSRYSYVCRLLEDAGGSPAYAGNDPNVSVPIDIEEAFAVGNEADVWLNTGQFTTLDALVEAVPRMAGTKPVRLGRVYNTSARSTAGGGNDYWESGQMAPHLVLRDLINILRPGLLPDSTLVYYEHLSHK